MGGGLGAPLAGYPSRSDAAVAILCPLGQALGAGLAKHPIVLSGAAVVVEDGVAPSCLGTRLQGTATLAVSLGQVEQEGGTVGTDHTGTLDQQAGCSLSIADQGSEAGRRDDGEHRSGAGGGGGLSPSLVPILPDRWGVARVET